MGHRVGGMEKYKGQAGTFWDNVTHSRNGTKSGGMENIKHRQVLSGTM